MIFCHNINGTTSDIHNLGAHQREICDIPANLNLTSQRLFVELAFITFYVAVAFYTIAITSNPMLPNMCAWVNIAFGVLLGIYIWLLFN